MSLTKRQKAYREYLASEHWEVLRLAAVKRDGGKCVRCGSTVRLQVHHLCYRGRYTDSLLRDLETVCRECHRKEHGFGPTDFEAVAREIDRRVNYVQRAPRELWLELKRLFDPESEQDVEDFGTLMFRHIYCVVAHEQEKPEWWLDQKVRDKWFQRAHNVRKSIWERHNYVW